MENRRAPSAKQIASRPAWPTDGERERERWTIKVMRTTKERRGVERENAGERAARGEIIKTVSNLVAPRLIFLRDRGAG